VRRRVSFGYSSAQICMCRNIKPLFNFDPPVTGDEIRAASVQFVRKISGFNKPSKANEAAFLAAIDDITGISARFLRSLETNAPPKNRQEEAEKAKNRVDQERRDLSRGSLPATVKRPATGF
jgi:hypothetical protein